MPEPLPRLLSALRAAVPELDGTALAEALWLAAHLGGDSDTEDGVRDGARPGAGERAPGAEPEHPGGPAPETAPAEHPDRKRPSHADDPRNGDGVSTRPLHERLPGSAAALRGHAVAAPQGTGLPRALELTRALRPWKRRWPQGHRHELDTDATVEGYARSGELIPVFKPAPERWFDLVLVVDRSPGMRVWNETVTEFAAVLDRLGAFRTLQTADLTFDTAGAPRAPGALRSADGRRLVVVVSDCMADAWRRPDVWHLLRDWAGTHPTAVLNPLPTKLWRRGGLDLPTTRFTPAAPGSPRNRVPVTPPALAGAGAGADAGVGEGVWLPVPVLSLTPHSLGRWSRSLMRGDPDGCTAVLVPPTGRTVTDRAPTGAVRQRARPLPPAERVRRFLRTASPRAARLAVLCAPFDRISLRLLHLVREKLVPEAGIADIAEVVTSGVFQVVQDGTTVELVLPPDIQEALRAHLPADRVWALHQALDQHLAHRGTGRAGLPSVARDDAGPLELAAEREAFARASRRTLELLGLAEPEGEEGVASGPAEYEEDADLPPLPEPYIGRPDLENAISGWLTTGSRVVALTSGGPSGVGRTALALRVAHSVRGQFPDGVVFLSFRGSTFHPLPAEAVMDQLLRRLGLPVEDFPDAYPEPRLLAATLRRALSGRRVLIVADDLPRRNAVTQVFMASPPEGCAVLATHPSLHGDLRHARWVTLRPSLGADAVRVFAAVGAPHPELVERGRWWPSTLRILGAAAASADPGVSVRATQIVNEAAEADELLSPNAVLRHWFDTLDGGSGSALAQLAAVSTAEFTLEEAEVVLEGTAPFTRELIDTFVHGGLLRQQTVGSYVFPHVVWTEAEQTPGLEGRRAAARARTVLFRRRAAAAFHRERHPSSRLTERLRVEPEPAPHPEVWVRNALEVSVADPDTLLLLWDAGVMPPFQRAFAGVARLWMNRESKPVARGRAALALAHAQHALGQYEEAWATLHEVGPDRLREDDATFPDAALLLARIALGRRSVDAARTAVSWATAAWDAGETRAREMGEVLRRLEEEFTASDEHEELIWVQERLVRYAEDLALPSAWPARLRLAATLLRNGRAREVEDALRPALGALSPADRAEADRLIRAAADPARILVALQDRSDAPRAARLLAGLPTVGHGRFASHVFDDCVLLLVDGTVPVAPLLQELVEWLPATRIAVHRGPVRAVPVADDAVTYTRTMLRSAEFVRTSENYPDDTTLCVSPEVHETLTHDTSDSELALRFAPREVRTEDGATVCVILTPRVDLAAWDPELLALARVFTELDPDGARLAGTLRAALDAELGRAGFAHASVAETEPAGREGVSGELAKRLSQQTFPFRLGQAAALAWERPGRAVPLDVDVSPHGPRMTPDGYESGRLCLLVYADDARSRWSAGLIRGGGSRPWFGSVLWLHRDLPLPENVLLGLPTGEREAVLAPADAVARVAEFFRLVRGSVVQSAALRPLIGERDWERSRERIVRLAGGVLRAEGLLLLAGNARGRAMAEALRVPVPAGDAYLCVPLVRRTDAHAARPAVTVDDLTWVVADGGDELAPLPTGFPSLRTRQALSPGPGYGETGRRGSG
ncbi:NaeI family type II restriction endonuclease [Streptomyces laurentii]|uniref:NaeI family type II restriction endonuclease n=1 Tax=Streptomyces laurentii TaxID=39478 RepID=UPI00369DA5C4